METIMGNTIEEMENELERLKVEIFHYEKELEKAKEEKARDNFKKAMVLAGDINEIIQEINNLGFTIDLEDCVRRGNNSIVRLEYDEKYKTIMVREI